MSDENKTEFGNVLIFRGESKTVGELEGLLHSDSRNKITSCSSISELFVIAVKETPCLAICVLSRPENFTELEKMLRSVSTLIRDRRMKLIVVDCLGKAGIAETLRMLGTSDIVPEGYPSKTLVLKSKLHFREFKATGAAQPQQGALGFSDGFDQDMSAALSDLTESEIGKISNSASPERQTVAAAPKTSRETSGENFFLQISEKGLEPKKNLQATYAAATKNIGLLTGAKNTALFFAQPHVEDEDLIVSSDSFDCKPQINYLLKKSIDKNGLTKGYQDTVGDYCVLIHPVEAVFNPKTQKMAAGILFVNRQKGKKAFNGDELAIIGAFAAEISAVSRNLQNLFLTRAS